MRKIDERKIDAVYEYICKCHSEEGRSPTTREIARACNISSTGWVSNLLQILDERDMITLIVKNGRRTISVDNSRVVKTRKASIVGSCPCGEPIFAEENIVATVALPVEIFGDCEHILLKAQGKSMIKRGIFNGDLMVVRLQNTADVGEVVVARINNEDATAKVLAKKNGKFYLEPANDEEDEDGERIYKNIYPKGDWEIVGVVDHVIHSVRKDVL